MKTGHTATRGVFQGLYKPCLKMEVRLCEMQIDEELPGAFLTTHVKRCMGCMVNRFVVCRPDVIADQYS